MQYVRGAQRTFTSTSDLSTTGQYYIVKLDGSNANSVVLAGAATDTFIGVCMNNPKAGDEAAVRLRNAEGTIPVVAGGTVAIGDLLTSNSSGQAITTTTAGNTILGQAVTAGVVNQIIEVIAIPGKY